MKFHSDPWQISKNFRWSYPHSCCRLETYHGDQLGTVGTTKKLNTYSVLAGSWVGATRLNRCLFMFPFVGFNIEMVVYNRIQVALIHGVEGISVPYARQP